MTESRRIATPPAVRLGPAARRVLWSNAALSAGAFLLAAPFLWMVLTSFKSLGEVDAESWLPGAAGWHPENYVRVFQRIPFARYYWNSIFVAVAVTYLQLITSAMAAFAFSRLRWRGRDVVFVLYLTTMMLPGLVLMVPNFQILISLGLVDTLAGLIVPAAFSTFGTFMLRQFMLSIPPSLDEAASIDGASKWRTFWDVVLPLARPGLVTLAIFTFMGNYNSFMWPLVILKDPAKLTLPVGLLAFDSSAGQETHLLMAAVTMSVVPMIVIFVLLQRRLVEGIQAGGVKG